MHIIRKIKEGRRRRKKARQAFSAYAKNGWESPWIRKNSLWTVLKK